MIDSGKGVNLVPDYAHSYVLDPETPTNVPDDIAKILLDQAPGIVSRKPFIVTEVSPAKEPEKIMTGSSSEPDKSDDKPEKNDPKKNKPEIELPSKSKQIDGSPIPN